MGRINEIMKLFMNEFFDGNIKPHKHKLTPEMEEFLKTEYEDASEEELEEADELMDRLIKSFSSIIKTKKGVTYNLIKKEIIDNFRDFDGWQSFPFDLAFETLAGATETVKLIEYVGLDKLFKKGTKNVDLFIGIFDEFPGQFGIKIDPKILDTEKLEKAELENIHKETMLKKDEFVFKKPNNIVIGVVNDALVENALAVEGLKQYLDKRIV